MKRKRLIRCALLCLLSVIIITEVKAVPPSSQKPEILSLPPITEKADKKWQIYKSVMFANSGNGEREQKATPIYAMYYGGEGVYEILAEWMNKFKRMPKSFISLVYNPVKKHKRNSSIEKGSLWKIFSAVGVNSQHFQYLRDFVKELPAEEFPDRRAVIWYIVFGKTPKESVIKVSLVTTKQNSYEIYKSWVLRLNKRFKN